MALIFMIRVVLNIAIPEFVNSSDAKPYKPLYAEVVAEISDDVILPSYMDNLEQAFLFDELAQDGCVFKISVYKKRGIRRLLPSGKEIYSYIEVIKWEPNGFHLIRLSFIDDEGYRHDYADEEALRSPATDRLRKYVPNP